MSDIKQVDIWSLELSNYFIKTHKYQLMTLNKVTHEMWLINPTHETYPILMISTQKTDDFHIEEIHAHRNALSTLLSCKPDGLNLSVNKESTIYNDHTLIVGPQYISSPSVLNVFPGLDTVLKVSGNLTVAMRNVNTKIRKNITKLQRANIIRSTMATSILSIVLVVTFLITLFISYQYEISFLETLLRTGAYYKPLILVANQWWRLITPMFLHGSFIHLFMNVVSMRSLAVLLEKELGSLRYLVTLVMGVLFGSMFLFIRNDPSIAVGISAGIYALLGLLIVFLYEKDLLKNKVVLRNVTTTILINIIISTLPNVSMTAHLGGFYAGVFLGFIFSKRKDWKELRIASSVLFVVSFIALIVLMVLNVQSLIV
ncbi:MAG: rhomboid family intramembrane serine protease [Erysipelothrix sp.]|nr:rhomboid family intramembrane serine protease [Erysipelothrix sp.]